MEQDYFEPGYFYHVFNRGNNYENIFKEERNYFFFLMLMRKHILQVSDIYCYCLLPNHFHLLLRMKEEEEIPDKYKSSIHQPFSNLFNSYTKSINRAYDRSGSLFLNIISR
jgi:putative transposase